MPGGASFVPPLDLQMVVNIKHLKRRLSDLLSGYLLQYLLLNMVPDPEESIQNTASEALVCKTSAMRLGYFHDEYLGLFCSRKDRKPPISVSSWCFFYYFNEPSFFTSPCPSSLFSITILRK